MLKAERLNTHRRRLPVKGGRSLEAAFTVLPSGTPGKSLARAIEARAIALLEARGFPLLSSTDRRNR